MGESQPTNNTRKRTEEQIVKLGEKLLEQKVNLEETEILVTGFENTTRKVQLLKVTEAYHIFKELIVYYGITQLLAVIEKEKISSFDQLLKSTGKAVRNEWINIGGQLNSQTGYQCVDP